MPAPIENVPLSQDRKEEMIRKLRAKGVPKNCPMCGTNNWTIGDGYFANSLQYDLSGAMALGGVSIPTLFLFCNNCGYISQHALGVLDLLPPLKGAEK